MTGRTSDAARIDRLFMIAFVPAIVFMVASLYVRMTSDPAPLWTEFSTPMFLALVGARAMAVPASPETRNTRRGVGLLLIVLSAILLFLAIRNSQGA